MPYRDHIDNILGVNSADNQFTSNLVAADGDGSMIERLEFIQDIVGGITAGNVILQGVAPAGTTSKTTIVIATLAGYGDDFFNNQFFMQILKNANSAGNAPEKETRKIADYASATGTFTTAAFSANVEAGDLCLILHESQVMIGRDDADNIADTSNVAANANGSVLERLEDLKDRMDAVDDYVDTEIAAIKQVADAIPDAGALTTLSGKIDTIDNFIDEANLEKISGKADGGIHAYPDSVADDSMLAYLMSKADPAAKTSYNNTTDSLEALSDAIADVQTEVDKIGTPAGADVSTDIAALDTKLGAPAGADMSTDIANVAAQIGTPAVDLVTDLTALIGTPAVDLATDLASVNTLIGTPAVDLVTDLTALIGTPAVDLATDLASVNTLIGTPAVDLVTDLTALIGTPAVDLATDVAALGTLIGTPAVDVATDVAAIQAAVDAFAAAGADGKAVVRKVVTFSNTNVDVNLFTITAAVNFKLYAFCTVNVESAAGCNIGVDLGSTVIIADTDCTTLEANDIWHDATPDASVELESVHEKYTAYGGTILLDVEGAKQVDSGEIVFVVVYTPLTANGAIAAV